ncbi:MAG: InlB B-repeat-containing protein [Firmicutes bacterium]|nr:InlB B-repeat-containing protein [Candidatus Fiminaster equi]
MKGITKRIISTLAICGALVLEAGAVAFGSLGKHNISRVDAATITDQIANWNTLFGTSYSGSISGVKANQLTLSGNTTNGISLVAKNGSSTNGYVNNTDFRMYSGYTLTVTAPTNYNITSLSASKSGKTINNIAADVGTLSIATDAASMSWTGSNNKIIFSISGTMGFSSMSITISNGSEPTTYSVTYDGNGNTGGSVPTDSTSYSSGASVTVKGNTGSLVKTGYTFAGWNTQADGNGTDRAAGGTFNITSNTTLYAKWTQDSPTPVGDADIINFDLTKDKLNGTATSGWVTDFSKTLSSGASVTIHSMGTKDTTDALRWNANGFLYQTTSGGTLDSVTIKGASKTVNIYGSATAFTGAPSGDATGTLNVTSSGATYKFGSSTNYTFLALKGTASSTTIAEITINYRTAKTVESIAVKAAPSKTEYAAGEDFDPVGLVITATYDSGDPEDIPYAGNESKFTFNPSTNLTQGTTSVQITYGGKSCNQTITVGPAVTLTSIQSITGSLTATIGSSWNTSNLVVTGLMSNSTTKNITSDCNVTVNTPVPSSAGTGIASVTATYKTDGTKTLTVTNIPYTVSAEHGTTSSDPLSISEAKAKIDSGISDADKNKTYYILGYYYSTAAAYSSDYKNISYWVTNSPSGSPNEFEFFRINCTEDPGYGSGDAIIVSCKGEKLQKFGSTYEVNTGDFYFTPYDVTFNGNGADETWENPTVSETWMSNYVLPETDPSKTGYEFLGWFTSTTGGTQITTTTVVPKINPVTVYAHWSGLTYAVTLDAKGGTGGSTSVTATYNANMPKITAPTKAGYTFNGYFDAETGGTKYYNTDGSSAHVWDKTSASTLYAQYSTNTYTVSFDSQGGSSCSSKTVTYNSTYGELPEPSKTGYTFAGWYTEAEGGSKVVSADTVLITANQTLYAHWTVNTYTVSFDSQGGSACESKTVTYNSTYGNLPEPTKSGNAFGGWYTAAEGGSKVVSTDTVLITANQTLYAHWTDAAYRVTFVPGDGATVSPTYKNVIVGEQYGELPEPSKTGHAFDGWYTAAEGGTKVVSTDIVSITSNQTLYAHWTANTYTVSFDSQGGSVCASKSVTYNSTYGELPESSKTGYTFDGWYTAAEGGTKVVSTDIVSITSNQTLYAHWTANTYTVSFDSQGGSSCSSKTVTYNSTYGELPEPSKTGYTFAGWYTASEGGSKVVSTDTVLITANQTLYAHWTANKYAVTFDGNDADVWTTEVIDEIYGSAYVLPVNVPTKVGYHFVGWFTEEVGGAQITSSTIVNLSAAQTLYAHFEINVYSVITNAGHSTPESEVTKLTHGSAYNNTFTAQEGWYIESITYTIEGSESVTVQGNALSIESVTNNLSITVNTVQIVLDHITVSPESVEIDYDGTVNKDNLVVTAFYNVGKDSARVTDFEIIGYDNKTPGTYEATVSYTEDDVTKTTTLTVVVTNKVVSLEVSGYDTTVDQGKDYVFNGKVVAHYQDGSTIENPEGVEVSKLDTSGHGLQTAKVSFGGVSVDITVNVIQTKTPLEPYQTVAVAGGAVIAVSAIAVGIFFFLKKFKI